MKIAILAITIGLFGAGVRAEEARPAAPTIHLFSEKNDAAEGLQVSLAQKEYRGVKTKAVEFQISIVNRLPEEVFVEVTPPGPANLSFQSETGGMAGAIGGGQVVFPDNLSLLKRLHATTVSQDGQRSTCSCAQATVKQSAELDLSEWIGCTGTLKFQVTGFYRTSGRRFSETIDLKFRVIDPLTSKENAAFAP